MKEFERLKNENRYLKHLLIRMMHQQSPIDPIKILTKQSIMNERIELLMDIFKGRTDTYALRWESKSGGRGYTPACALEWQKPVCQKPIIKCNACQHRKLLPLSDHVIFEHLEGKKTVGIYPLLKDGTCWFLAVDFDKSQWQSDVLSFIKTCKSVKVPFHIERSRSGNGAHVWIFFSSAISATTARKLGMTLLRKTKEKDASFQLESFDRLFRNQDTLADKDFGNLIALPLQKKPAQNRNSLFVNENFIPYPDQWLYLSTVRKMTIQEVNEIIYSDKGNTVYDVKDTLYQPEKIQVELKNGIYVNKAGLPPSLLSDIAAIASFTNPEFYRAQRRRFSTYGIPRMINCASDELEHLILPRGCLKELLELCDKHSINLEIVNHTFDGEMIEANFHGKLTSQQDEVVRTMIENDYGTLSATTGFGKTVVAAAMIANRKVNTLIIVHRTQLINQWVEKLATFLNVSSKEIGQIGGGKNHITGKIDVATIQSLNYGGQLKSFITQYGQIIIDECHIISAITFEQVLKQIRPKYVFGLTATPKRKDGMGPIITMQCGPIYYKIDAKMQAKIRPFGHRLITRSTNFNTKQTEFQKIYGELSLDSKRNHLIFDDVLKALETGRSPIILTERLEHLDLLKKQFRGFAKNIIILSGNMKKKDQKKELERLSYIPENEERLIIATGKYIGEGFDDARLDTLFLTMPISWKGTLQQYVGRLHRDHDQKQEVQVYDYVDENVPMLKAMFDKRLAGYKGMGYVTGNEKSTSEQMRLF
ncbi:DEAD/DEAH box helicase [Bacillus sp. FJAT-49711]|uniref:TOTE conflict system archaeo-eukaryotic primase domain-containing protein n=1 Tax=Bacillus sp. FJAT-49711 TaxID=2833585 RepID=UPI001BCA1A5E|nr:DEAD/DEAH box helicase [Bacillus sp. FJAT-49711]MBS4219176.1 DEAD/DEAH box helicase [Bacillus sp. FJAT-49711]